MKKELYSVSGSNATEHKGEKQSDFENTEPKNIKYKFSDVNHENEETGEYLDTDYMPKLFENVLLEEEPYFNIPEEQHAYNGIPKIGPLNDIGKDVVRGFLLIIGFVFLMSLLQGLG